MDDCLIAEIQLKDDFWRVERMNRQRTTEWVKENNPLLNIIDMALLNDASRFYPTLLVKYQLKTEEELFRERFESLLGRLQFMESPLPKVKVHECGVCPECERNVKGWEPMFGGLAPEWWATMRERGIDPATGHLASCRNKKYKY